jgi:hypothetical protein
MKNSGQRQDLAFLALAVAVLAVAVALFVGMKALPKTKKEKPEPAPAVQAEPVAKVPKDPKGAARDPFSKGGSGSAGAVAQPAPITGGTSEPELKFYGIVSEKGDPPVATIHSTKKRYYARVGDRVAGYTVLAIGEQEVVLEKAGSKLTLRLYEPEPVDE